MKCFTVLSTLGRDASKEVQLEISEKLEHRVVTILEIYDHQGLHRTGTDADTANAHWLADYIQSLGEEPILTGLSHCRVDPVISELHIGDQVIEGLPFYDASFTDSDGVVGKMGWAGDRASIGVGHYVTNRTWVEPELIEGRKGEKYEAMIAICKQPRSGDVPGLTPTNAEDFFDPFGPPILQVANGAEDVIAKAISDGVEVRVIAQAERTDVEAFNVETTIAGKDRSLPPLVVMTPRSGWCHCVSERGGGIVCWLEMIRAFAQCQPDRDVKFVASTGHELNHLGLHHFLAQHEPLIKEAHCWIHLGANSAAVDCPVRLQASDDVLKTMASEALEGTKVPGVDFTPMDVRPGGEARNIYDGGGRYLSLLGANRLFHHPDDRWPDAIGLEKIVSVADAFTRLAMELASSG